VSRLAVETSREAEEAQGVLRGVWDAQLCSIGALAAVAAALVPAWLSGRALRRFESRNDGVRRRQVRGFCGCARRDPAGQPQVEASRLRAAQTRRARRSAHHHIRATLSAKRVGPRLYDLRKRLCQHFERKGWLNGARVTTVRYPQRRIASYSIRAAQLLHRCAPRAPAGALSVHDL